MPYGKKVKVRTLSKEITGYSGLFSGTIYKHHGENDGEEIISAQYYFRDLAEENGDDDYDYWDLISELLQNHCSLYIDPYVGFGGDFNYQSGFGGDDGDGTVDFFTEKKILRFPDMLFQIVEQKYVMKFTYSDGQ